MSWDGADAEGLARWIYEAAGVDPAEPPGPMRLARALDLSVETAPRRALWGDGTRIKIRGKWTIYLAPKLAPRHRAFALAHELAEWAQREREDEETEGLCDAAAAAILAPATAFRWALANLGTDLPQLANAFQTTESCVALRVGEVTGEPVSLVSPALVRVRGDEFGWPSEAEIRRLAQVEEPTTGMISVRLSDDSRRFFVRAA